MNSTHTAYWLKQALKHERMAITLKAKYERTGEIRWLNQSIGNIKSARRIRSAIKDN